MKTCMPTLKKGALALCVFTASLSTAFSQKIGFDFPEGEKKIAIPFEKYNNLVVIPIVINGAISVKFILDTGVQYPILTEKTVSDLLELKYDRRIVIESPGEADSISALVVNNIGLTLPGGISSGVNQSILVLEKDLLELRKHLGAEIHGIIGYDIFNRFVVEINYNNNVLTLYEPETYKPKKYYKKVPLEIQKTKPYILANVKSVNNTRKEMRLMIDTGASHGLMLENQSEQEIIPDKTIDTILGRGLGGIIHGKLGRVAVFEWSNYELEDVIASFPSEGAYSDIVEHHNRNGTIGGEVLSRFIPVFDYWKGMLYLRKSEAYQKEFEHDMSGLDLLVEGTDLETVRVVHVRKGSPADLGGIMPNDLITSINGLKTSAVGFSIVTTLLRSKPGRKVSLKINRNGEIIKASIKLKRFI